MAGTIRETILAAERRKKLAEAQEHQENRVNDLVFDIRQKRQNTNLDSQLSLLDSKSVGPRRASIDLSKLEKEQYNKLS